MFRLVLRKMMNNKWMVGCLLLGSILASAMVSAIPMYTDGVTQRMLKRDLQAIQLETEQYPGWLVIDSVLRNNYESGQFREQYNKQTADIEQAISNIHVPLISSSHRLSFDMASGSILPIVDGQYRAKNYRIDAFSGMQNEVKVLQGRLPTSEVKHVENYDNGAEIYEKATIFEGVITRDFVNSRRLKVGDVIDLQARIGIQSTSFLVEIVGIVEPVNNQNSYWYVQSSGIASSLILDYDALYGEFCSGDSMLVPVHQWVYAFDYQKMSVSAMPSMLNGYNAVREVAGSYKGLSYKALAHASLTTYLSREAKLKTTLWVLEVPLLIMLAFYIFMVSQLIIDYEKNEISVLKSRGSTNSQILWLYLMQSLIISGIALVIGPYIGMFLCWIIGASNGFLSFVSRTALPLHLSANAFEYAMLALSFSVITMLLPALLQARTTIVEHKQRKARGGKAPLWKKLGLDFILLAASIYGISFYRAQGAALSKMTPESAALMPIDPILFLISVLFVLGAGLLVLRLYPLVMRLVFWLGRKKWNAVMYATFVQVGRSNGNEQFLMLFLIMTISIGLFSANAARTINYNQEARMKYSTGADIVLDMEWVSSKEYVNALPSDFIVDEETGSLMLKPGLNIKSRNVYTDIPLSSYQNLTGIEETARVYIGSKIKYFKGGVDGVQKPIDHMMGIDPYNFGMVAYAPPLIQGRYNWYSYLNLLNDYPEGLLVSQAFLDSYNLKLFDDIYVGWDELDPLPFTIIGVIDYWPTISPYATVTANEDGTASASTAPIYCVGNLQYMFRNRGILPYQLWLKRDGTTSNVEIYQSISDHGLPVAKLTDGKQELISMRNDPMLQGTNGSMTLSFIMTLAVSAVGFVIYWMLSIRSRSLQFGIFRAIGLKMQSIFGMLVAEQLLISGVAVMLGLLIGELTSYFYVPLLEIVYATANQAPAFKVVSSSTDYWKIYIFIGIMLVAGIALLVRLVSKIKITQAIKLGED
nr:FtsX-like permease family protein [bacterium]